MSDDGIRYPGKFNGFGGGHEAKQICVPVVPEEEDPYKRHYTIHVAFSFADEIEEFALKNQLTPEHAICRLVMRGLKDE